MQGLSQEADYSQLLSSPFEITGPLDTFRKEAQAKGWAVVVSVGFITLDEFFGGELEQAGDDEDE
jgi:hypothetical protein